MSRLLTRKKSTLKSKNSSNDNSVNIKTNNIDLLNGLIIKPLTKNNNSMLYNNNNNNNQINSKHFSPSSNRVKSSLAPVINNYSNQKRMVSSQKKNKIIKLINSSSLRDIYSQKNIMTQKFGKNIGREKTQADIAQNLNMFNNNQNNKKEISDIFFLKSKADTANNKKYKNNNINSLKQINNINVNIHIYSQKINNEIENNKKKTINNAPVTNTDNNLSLINNINNDNINDKNLINERINFGLNRKKNNKSIALTPKKEIINEYMNTENKKNQIKSKFINNQYPISNKEKPETSSSLFNNMNAKEKIIQKEIASNLKTISPISVLAKDFSSNNRDDSFNKNFKSSTLKLVGNLVIKDNIENNKKILNKRYESDIYDDINYFDDKNVTRNEMYINNDNDIKKIIASESDIFKNNKEEINMINEASNFLKEFNGENDELKILIIFMKLIQIHIDIELILDNKISNNFRRRITTINNDKIFKLNSLINNYFNNLTYLKELCQILDKDSNNILINSRTNNNCNNNFEDLNNLKSDSELFPAYNIFIFSVLNNIFHKCIKIQMCFYSAFMVSLSQLDIDNIDNVIKNNYHKIIKEISNPLYNIFKIFLMDEMKEKYNKLISNNLRPDFFDNINKLFNDENIISSLKKSEIIQLISSNINKCADSLKNYSDYNLRNSIIKPFGDALNQMIFSITKKSLNRFIYIFINVILFGELDINKQKMQINLEDENKNNIKSTKNKKKKKYLGSALYNNVKDKPPFLPEIDTKYKFTLVLDMDETLVHFFFTTIKGMFFIRPYCLEFLNELNNYYEIVTFTAGIKDYADNILNLLDINDNIIKYRLYRPHVTIAGFTSYKDLQLLGRDLKKIIIIDNLRENFKLQPDNGLFIKTWTSDVNDTQFKDLLVILKSIAINDVNDVRPIIQRINEKIKDNGDLINPYAKINIERIIEDEKR